MSLSLAHGNVSVERIDPRMLSGQTTYFFNIYSTEHEVNTGSTGRYYIPPCPEGQAYIRAAQSVPGTVEDIYPHFSDKEEYRSRAVPGEDIAKAVLGIGLGQPEGGVEDIRRFGVFSSNDKTPSKAELAAAKVMLVKELQRQLAEADRLFASANSKDVESARDPKYFAAARYMNVKKPWLSEAAEMTTCPFCSIAVSPNASICHGCNQVVNVAAFEATKKLIQGNV